MNNVNGKYENSYLVEVSNFKFLWFVSSLIFVRKDHRKCKIFAQDADWLYFSVPWGKGTRRVLSALWNLTVLFVLWGLSFYQKETALLK